MWPFFTRVVVPLLVVLASLATLSHGQGRTRPGFYFPTCHQAESIVQSTVRWYFDRDPTIAAGLLKLHFRDCFVQGCDASILISGPNTERTAGPNLLLKGYEVIETAKAGIEKLCPGIVSCADILALAARDSVVLSGGKRWIVPTGRRDGVVSLASDTANLPDVTDSIAVQIQKFRDKNLNTQDFVTLVGGHTIGTSACQNFRYRLYNFNASGGADPTIDPTFLPTLQALCPANGDSTRRVGLDNESENQFDTNFFSNVANGRAALESDQRLFSDSATRSVVQRYLEISGLLGLTFNFEFGQSMIKMSNIGVKTGTTGEIRNVCSAIN